VIGVLEIIFGGDPIACLLRITRQGAVFLQQLAGVSTLPVVEATAIIAAAAHLLWTRASIAAAASPVLVVSDQLGVPVFTDGVSRDAGNVRPWCSAFLLWNMARISLDHAAAEPSISKGEGYDPLNLRPV
jgi:hypothetical protein